MQGPEVGEDSRSRWKRLACARGSRGRQWERAAEIKLEGFCGRNGRDVDRDSECGQLFCGQRCS